MNTGLVIVATYSLASTVVTPSSATLWLTPSPNKLFVLWKENQQSFVPRTPTRASVLFRRQTSDPTSLLDLNE